MAIRLGNKAEGQDFFDRVTEREDIWRFLESNHLLLSGPRRLGKTSLLQRLAEEAEAKQFLPQLVDVEGIDSVEAFISAIDQAFPEKTVSHYLKKVSGLIKNVSKVNVGLPGGFSGGIEIQAKPDTSWAEAASHLQTRLSAVPTMIFIDEFSVFLEKLIDRDINGAVKLLGWIRAWRMSSGLACRFIFSGSISLNSLLDRHGLITYFNDCYDYKLGPFRLTAALEMLKEQAKNENWQGEAQVFEHLCQRTGWLSPFYLNLLLSETLSAARDRELEEGLNNRKLQISDIDDGYHRLLATRSRFSHWYKRLERDLNTQDFAFVRILLAAVAKPDTGLTRKQLSSRLQRVESDPDQRSIRLDSLLLKLEEDGYISLEGQRIQFLSFLLRDYWRRNHG